MRKTVNRRSFLRDSFTLCTGFGAAAACGGKIWAQAGAGALRRPDRYDDTLIFSRKRFSWPGGKSLALWIIPNVEAYLFSATGTAGGGQDVVGYSWREYGTRVGLWRIADV